MINTYSIYFDTKLFINAAATAVHGNIEDRASASRQDRMYARTKHVMNDEMYMTHKATFSDMPDCTRSIQNHMSVKNRHDVNDYYTSRGRTCIRLNPRRDFSRPDVVKERDLLT